MSTQSPPSPSPAKIIHGPRIGWRVKRIGRQQGLDSERHLLLRQVRRRFGEVAKQPLATVDDYITGGRAMQRFWLTATHLGLQFQPEMTPLIFASYIYHDVAFSTMPRSLEQARRLVKRMEDLMGVEACRQGVYMGRVGFGAAPVARSIRLTMDELMRRIP